MAFIWRASAARSTMWLPDVWAAPLAGCLAATAWRAGAARRSPVRPSFSRPL